MAVVTRVSGNAMVEPVMELLKDVINKEDSHRIPQIDLRRMESLLQDIATLLRVEVDVTTFSQDQQKAPLEIVKTWLQLLRNSLAEAERLLSIDRSGTRQSCLDCLLCNHIHRRLTKEVRDWNAFFDHLYRGFQSDLSIFVASLEFNLSKPLYKDEALLQDVTASGFGGSRITDAQAQVERWVNEGVQIHVIGVYGMPSVGKTSLLKRIYNKYKYEKIWVTVPEDCNIFDLQGIIADQIFFSFPTSFDERKMRLSRYLKDRSFLLVLDDLWSRLDLQEVGVAFGDGKHSKVIFSTRRKDLIREMKAEESAEIQPLSKDDGWMLFRRVAFEDDQVSMDIEDRARKIADECRGLPLAINVVAAAMIGPTSVHEWDMCLSSIRNVDPSFPATHPRLDAELYAGLRYSYDALPNSDVKNCFLYCAMYKEDEEIDSHTLLQMWIGEGLVKRKQGTCLMDMAIGLKYLKLLVDRCLFQRVRERTNVLKESTIKVHHCVRDMAVYIGQKEENCLFMASQRHQNFPQVHVENCSRISLAINSMEDLHTELRCLKLASLTLKENQNLKEIPSEFLLGLTSLRVLNLSGCTKMTSVPTSIGQLRMLEFLSLSGLPIKDLPEEICHLSGLQFLHLSSCRYLESLPSKIGELKNLKHLNLNGSESLNMIPREISELTSLSRLQLWTDVSVEMEAPASIWSLKGLKNLTELQVLINERQDGERPRIKDGIMGTWSAMRHLHLGSAINSDEMLEDLPQDMQNMKKLHSFRLWRYKGLSLPNCKFEHLEMVELYRCTYMKDLSCLEWLPNLKLLKLKNCSNLGELGIGSPGRIPSGYLMLQKLVLTDLEMLESLAGPSNTGVWDERTLPHLRVLKIRRCLSLKRFPNGVEKLSKLCAIIGYPVDWWKSVIWEDDNTKIKFEKIFKEYLPNVVERRGPDYYRYFG